MKIALLGGAFDPPTLGHMAVAKFVLNSKAVDEVWLTPCFRHMFNKKMSSVTDRLMMLNCITQDEEKIKVFDYEIQHQLSGQTYYFLKSLLNSEYAQIYEFSHIIGMDNANNFHNWFNYEELRRLIRFIVVPRTGENPDLNVNWYLNPPHIFLKSDKPLPNTASSIIRDTIKKMGNTNIDETVLKMIDPRVWIYIQKNELYCS